MLAVLVTLFAIVVYAGARSVLLAETADRMTTVAERMTRELQAVSADPFGAVSARTALADQTFLDGFAGGGVYIEAFNQSGHPIGKSTNLGTIELPAHTTEAWKPHSTVAHPGAWGFADLPDGRALVNQLPLRNGADLVATIAVAQSLASMDSILKGFRNFLLLGLAVALGFIAVASVSLARAALGPVDRIARAAREIGGEDLSKRVNWKGRADELGALAQAFDDMLERLEAAFARERRFIADASHELKTPLTVINANAQMLERWGARDPKIMSEALSTIETESATMARVINAMLTLAKTDNPDALTFETVDLGRLVRDVGAALRPTANAKGLTLELEVNPDQEIPVRGEPGLVRQLVTNLTENAIKFTAAGSVCLAVRRRGTDAELVVRDSGPGIPADALPHVFERFYRADPARSRNVEGTGLGLAVVSNIVRVHGGRITVDSRVGDGTSFTVVLPVA
ncbi:MAG: HAMP domain-containing histidine kinase [Candidatus Eremiobacteraeota bacterium]|nr:HAMP domain-containing histidine kinase [Candidatus Eremiobacteraeota bacterium]